MGDICRFGPCVQDRYSLQDIGQHCMLTNHRALNKPGFVHKDLKADQIAHSGHAYSIKQNIL